MLGLHSMQWLVEGIGAGGGGGGGGGVEGKGGKSIGSSVTLIGEGRAEGYSMDVKDPNM